MAAHPTNSVVGAMPVSTHSHPKVAAPYISKGAFREFKVSTHSHPKVAATDVSNFANLLKVSTHSHPKVAAYS